MLVLFLRRFGNRKNPPSSRNFLALIAMVLAGQIGLPFAARAEIAYDNTHSYLTNFYASLREIGDEIKLSGLSSNITDFQFEYFGDFSPTGRETARLRFYVNDGPGIPPKPDTIFTPQTVLYDSGPLPIAPGFNALEVRKISATVPSRFTWTVEFGGLAGTDGSKAGLVFFNPPTVGSSFDDFWQRSGTNWSLFRFDGRPIANFGSRAVAPDAPFTVGPPTRLNNGQIQLQFTGPVGRDFLLEFSTHSVDWAPLSTNRLVVGSAEYLDARATNYNRHFYRAALLPETLQLAKNERLSDGRTRLEFSGPPNAVYEIQGSNDSINWTAIIKGVIPAGTIEFVTEPSQSSFSAYRVVLVSPPPVTLSSDVRFTNNLFLVDLGGPPGRRYVVQASTNCVDWTSVSTNIFSFTSGGATYIDTAANSTAQRFYRAFLAP